MLKIINEINDSSTTGAAEINRIAIEGRTHSLQKVSAELLPHAQTKSRVFFNRQTRVYDEMQRWSITGRFKFWLALLRFGAPFGYEYTRGKIADYFARLDDLYCEELGRKGFPVRLRNYFEIKEELDQVSAQMTRLFLENNDYELKKLIKRQMELLKEIENFLDDQKMVMAISPAGTFGRAGKIN